LIRRIRELLYEQGFTISGARHRLDDGDFKNADNQSEKNANGKDASNTSTQPNSELTLAGTEKSSFDFASVKTELRSILSLLRTDLRTS
jgi:hypothetical protein